MLLLIACSIDPAPPDVDGLAHWTWVNYDIADEEALVDAGEVLRGFENDDGIITDLQAEELAHLELDGSGLDRTRGWYVVNRFPCDIDALTEALIDLNQDTWREYESYSRSYTGDREAFDAGETDVLTWDTDYAAKYVTATYTCHSTGGVRRVGDTLQARTWFREPCGSDDEDYTWNQDYQNELYVADGDEIVHLYSMWREIEAAGLDQGDDGLVNLMQNGMRDWDDTTAEACLDF
jgi:hypothetical protein